MRSRTLVLSVLFCVFAGASFAQQPNVVVVMTDDQGYGELSAHGNPVLKTPNLDRLRTQSVRLSDFHVAPMCTPTRGQLLTGLDAARNGAINVSSGRALLRPEIPTMANFFANAGYRTGIFGKWHLGDNYPFRPEDRGFDETVWFPSSHIGSVPDFWGNDYFDDTYIHNGKRKAYKGYCTDIFFDEAMDHMKRSVEADKPFLAYIATNTPHWPLFAKEEDEAVLRAALADSKFDDMSGGLKDGLSGYLGMVRNIDTNMGKLVKFLDDEGLRENTILIFMTDNGSIFGPRYFNAGMRGMKTELWDGGHRVPFFISWPKGGFAEPQDVDGLTQVQDVLPTLLDLADIEAPAANFSGMSLAPVLRGEENVDEDRTLIINYSRMPSGFNYPSPYTQSILTRNQAGVLWKRWRLLEDRELYNLETDPLQTTNVLEQHPQVVAKMRDHLYTWWDEVGPTANEPQRIIIGNDIENPMMLTGCEWLDVFVDQQGQIRRGTRKTGYWLLDVAEAGEYEIALRRWPEEIDVPLASAPEGGGRALPISRARLFINDYHHMDIGEKKAYGFEGLTTQVDEDDTEAVFNVTLPKGPLALHTWFEGKGDIIASAYYAYVTRK